MESREENRGGSPAISGAGESVEAGRTASDPDEGYRFVRESAGVAERQDLATLKMYGRDPVRMLNGLITNDLLNAEPDRAVYGAVLTPKGRIITDLRVVRTSESPTELVMDVPRAALPAFREHLGKYVPPLFARWGDAEMEVLGVYGPRSPEVLEAALEMAADPTEDVVGRGEFAGTPVFAVGTSIAGGEKGFDLLVPSAASADLRRVLLERAEEVGGGSVGASAFEVLRVEAGAPRYGIDFDDQTLPAEIYEGTGWMARAVSFTKGCYTGQEVVVRIAHRGHVNRMLRRLLLGDEPPPAARTPLRHPETGKEVGWITSAVRSPRFGKTIALGMVRREIELGQKVVVGDGSATAVVAALGSQESGVRSREEQLPGG